MNVRKVIAPLLAIILVIPVVLLFKHLVFDQTDGTYVVKAELEDASGLVENSNVKIGGIPAGIVTDLTLTEEDTALLTMVLGEGSGVIGEGATAAARPVNLLGEKYVDLDVGDLDEPVDSGTLIPLARTSTPVELDDVLNTFQPDVRSRLRLLINEAGVAMTGRGADFNGLLEELPPAIDELGTLVADVRTETDTMKRLIEESDRVLSPIARERDNLGELVESAGDALDVTAEKRVELADTFEQAPTALTQLRSTLTELDATSDSLRPAAADLRMAAGPLENTLEQLPAFADAAENVLETASDVSPALERLGARATPTVRRLEPTAVRLDNFTRDSDPVIRELSGGGGQVGEGAFASLMGVMHNWSLAIQNSDGVGHLFGLRLNMTRNTLNSAIERYSSPGDVESNERPGSGREGGSAARKSSTQPKAADAFEGDAAEQAPADDRAAGDRAGDLVKKTLDDVKNTVESTRDELVKQLEDKLGRAAKDIEGLGKLSAGELEELLAEPRSQIKNALDELLSGSKSSGSRNSATRLLDYLLSP
ncbi:MAG: MCE family protein [Thermoleophilaceae bacterium]|nr:MCE family protein [Thermoleophilaceae bacterium]